MNSPSGRFFCLNGETGAVRMNHDSLVRNESDWSAALRRMGDNVQKRKFDEALAESNAWMSKPNMASHDKGRVLALVADCEFKRGRYAEAGEIHLNAAAKSMEHPTLWLRPYVGCVRALLKAPRVDEALVMARHAMAIADAKMAEFDESVRRADQDLHVRAEIATPAVPLRPSVVATRMGFLFLQEGEPEAAKEFFQKAVSRAKGGANRARQGLALAAMAKGEYEDAAKRSADAIRLGRFRVKTIPAWSIHISACRQLGNWRIRERLIKGLNQAPAGVRARATVSIATELRRNGMRQWRQVADEWLAKEGARFPRYENDLLKLILASAKLDNVSATIRRETAAQLLRLREIGFRDWLAAAKESVRAGILSGASVDPDRLLREARNRYGDKTVPVVAHSLALTCSLVKRSELARSLLGAGIAQARAGSRQWSKSIWALARLEKEHKNHLEAARLFKLFFEAQDVPARFRLQAQLQWAQQLIEAGDADAFWDAHERMTQTLASVQDPEILMNFARQTIFGPPELKEWGREIFLQGEAMAIARFNAAAQPEAALDVLFKLARRQVVDFDRSSVAVKFWEDMDDVKRDWLWSASSVFWEYMGCLFMAYLRSNASATAEEFARSLLNDAASPPSGLPYVGVPYATYLIVHARTEDGLALCGKMADGAPRNPACAWAWYWLALKSWSCGSIREAKERAQNVQGAQGLLPGTLDGQRLDARARLLSAELDVSQIDLRSAEYAESFVAEQLTQLRFDLGRFQ